MPASSPPCKPSWARWGRCWHHGLGGGLCLQIHFPNLVARLTLAVYRPFRIGNLITLENQTGTVEDITLHHTTVRIWENKRLVIPNEKFDSMSLTNHSLVDPKILLHLDAGISYGSDIDQARALMPAEAAAYPQALDEEQAPAAPLVRVIDLDDSSVNLRIMVWVPGMKPYHVARAHLLEAIKKSPGAGGVEIPYPHRVVIERVEGGGQRS